MFYWLKHFDSFIETFTYFRLGKAWERKVNKVKKIAFIVCSIVILCALAYWAGYYVEKNTLEIECLPSEAVNYILDYEVEGKVLSYWNYTKSRHYIDDDFLRWAFGENYGNKEIHIADILWNERHGDILELTGAEPWPQILDKLYQYYCDKGNQGIFKKGYMVEL